MAKTEVEDTPQAAVLVLSNQINIIILVFFFMVLMILFFLACDTISILELFEI